MESTHLYVPIYTSTARTATPTVAVFDDLQHPRLGGQFIIVSTAASTPSTTPLIEGFDTLSNSWYPILTGAAIVATGTVVLKVYPGFAATANVSVSDFLPPRWRLTMTHGNANSHTYSVAAILR